MPTCDGVFEHFFHFVDALIDAELFGIADVLFALRKPHFGVLDHEVDFFCEVFGVGSAVEVALVAGEVFCGRFFAVGDDGDESAGNGFDAGDRLDFRISAMDVKVAKMNGIYEVILFEERNDGRVGELASEFL